MILVVKCRNDNCEKGRQTGLLRLMQNMDGVLLYLNDI
jgi:hypothetical protein